MVFDVVSLALSVTPMVAPVQAKRPFKWVNWDAARVKDLVSVGNTVLIF